MTKVDKPVFVNTTRASSAVVEKRKMPDKKGSFLVFQREFGLVYAPRFVKTVSFSDCIVTTFFCPSIGIGGMAHFDRWTHIQNSFERVIIPRLQSISREAKQFQSRLIGGEPNISENIRQEILRELSILGIEILGIEPNGRYDQGAIMETASGEVHELIHVVNDIDSLKRLNDGARYLAGRNSLIRDVSQL